ncbi:MAG: PAS domain-containing protein, partial [Actinomycetota bacterium]
MSTTPETLRRPGFPAPTAEEARRTQERFQLAARATQDLLWDWDLIRGEIVWAGTTGPYFGLPPEQIAPVRGDQYRNWADRVHPDDLSTTETASRAAIESGAESWEHEYRFRRADDSYANILERAFIARDEAGRALRIVGAMRDVSTRRRAESTSTRLAAIVASSSDAIVGKTLDGIITSWNAGAERMFGYTAAEAIGQSIMLVVPPERRDEELSIIERIRHGQWV